MWAPNAHNAQPWRFVHLASTQSRESLAEAMGREFRLALQAEGIIQQEIKTNLARSRARLLQAPEVILICVERAGLRKYKDDKRTQGELQMALQSAAMAGALLLLAAHAEGLGAVWVCAPMFAPKEVAHALELPGSWEAQGIVYLGHPARPAPARPRVALKDVLLTR